MLIAQISDLHLGFVPDDPDEMNARRLDAVIERLLSLPTPARCADRERRPDRARRRSIVSPVARQAVGVPVPGALRARQSRQSRRVRRGVSRPADARRLPAICDRLRRACACWCSIRSSRGGTAAASATARAAWLAERLDEEPDRPTLIVLHHPPIETGIGWLTTDADEPWVRRLADAIAGRGNIVALLCGHIHRSIAGRFEGPGRRLPADRARRRADADADRSRPPGRPRDHRRCAAGLCAASVGATASSSAMSTAPSRRMTIVALRRNDAAR